MKIFARIEKVYIDDTKVCSKHRAGSWHRDNEWKPSLKYSFNSPFGSIHFARSYGFSSTFSHSFRR